MAHPYDPSCVRPELQLWLETAGSATPRTQTLVERQTAAERMKRLAHESGRTFFDVLEPSVRRRTSTWLAELEIKRDSVETLRPWRAFGVIVSAFWSTRQMSYTPVPVDAVLREMAQAAGKRIDYEFPTGEDVRDLHGCDAGQGAEPVH